MAHSSLAIRGGEVGESFIENPSGHSIPKLVPGTISLYFPVEARAMRTPFRDAALNFIYQTALDLSDDRLKSAIVEVWSSPGEEDSLTLNLTLEVDTNRDAIKALRYETLARVTEWLRSRTEEEKADYGRRVYFGVVPSHS